MSIWNKTRSRYARREPRISEAEVDRQFDQLKRRFAAIKAQARLDEPKAEEAQVIHSSALNAGVTAQIMTAADIAKTE